MKGLFALFLFALLSLGASPRATADALHHGSVFKDCPDCPELVAIKPGSFIMGNDQGDKYERPAHKVTLAKAFALGRFEITFDDWTLCVSAKGCTKIPDDHLWGRGKNPVINVSFAEIQTYLKWLSAKTGHHYRLPSEAEWEYSARAGTITKYWWGDEIGLNNANCRKCGAKWSGSGSAPVGSFKPNPWGLYDMNGNAWDWVGDCWNPSHDGAPSDGSTRLTGDCKNRVTRGGSWYYFPKLAASSYRYKNHIDVFSYNITFRVLREFEAGEFLN